MIALVALWLGAAEAVPPPPTTAPLRPALPETAPPPPTTALPPAAPEVAPPAPTTASLRPAAPAAISPPASDPPLTVVERVSPPAPIWTVPAAHSAGVLVGMRLSLSVLWPDPYDPFPLSRSSQQFGLAYREPPEFRPERALLESDGDPWVINVIGHGLFGAEVYGRVRQCGGGPWQALAFVAGTSLLWEYGIESFHKRPSGVDLVLTPVIGMALGEGRVQLQRWLRRRPRTFWRRFTEIVIDPLGEGERGLLRTRC